jgi:zinc protease
VDVLATEFDHKAAPELFSLYVRVKDPAQVGYVRDQILKTFERFKTEQIDQARLDATRSRMRYGFAMAMNSNDRIAAALAPYIALERTPETLNRLFDTYQTVSAADVRDAVKKYFREESRTVVTLATKGQNIAALGRAGEGQN